MKTFRPHFIHGLPVMTLSESVAKGFASITTNIQSDAESAILAGVCQHRNPERSCLIWIFEKTYQLAILRQDISDLS